MMENRALYSAEHATFRDSVRRFFAREVTPNIDAWEKEGMTPREFWTKCGQNGLLCPMVPEQYGGPGADFLHQSIICEELGYSGQMSTTLQTHTDIISVYIQVLGTEE